MNYALAVLSHSAPGSDYSATAEECLDSFYEHVTPEPAFRIFVHDGPGYAYAPGTGNFFLEVLTEQRGFCGASKYLWELGSRRGIDYVFWLEHDFRFNRAVNLEALAAVLTDTTVAQVALMRDAVNDEEKAAGGLFESRYGEYRPELLLGGRGYSGGMWQRHRSYFTTNPSLMRSDFMEQNPWPDYGVECEGKFGLDLVERGYSFGVWGEGEPWVTHIGTRTGKGY